MVMVIGEILVFVIGFLIVIGLSLLIYALVDRGRIPRPSLEQPDRLWV